MTALRPYQQELIDAVRAAYGRGHRRVVAVMPTGAGKGQTIGAVVRAAVGKGRRVLVLAHRRRLISQLRRTIDQWGVGEEVVVESVQTVTRRMARMEAPDLIVIDEAHHLIKGNMWGKIIDAWPDAYLLGKTATPERLDGRGLGDGYGGYFQEIVEGPTAEWLTAQGFLARARVFCPPNQLDRRKLRIVRGDYAIADVEEELINGGIYGDAVEQYLKHVHPGTALVACVSVSAAQMVAEQYREAGISSAVITQGCSEEEQERVFGDLAEGVIKIVAYCEMLSEGVDVPSVKATQLLRPTASLVMYLQQVGRALRPKPDGGEAIVLDHVGNVQKHGLPTDVREWSLEGRKKRANDAPSVKVCPSCFVALPSQAAVCDCCGHVFHRETARKEREQIDGDLVEVRAQQLEDGADVEVWFGKHWKPGFVLVEWPAEGAPTVQRASGGNTWKVKREHVRLPGSGGKYSMPTGRFQVGDEVLWADNPGRASRTILSVGHDVQFGQCVWLNDTRLVNMGNGMPSGPFPVGKFKLFARPNPASARKHEQGNAQTLEELIQVGQRRGMKNPRGWARHVLAARSVRAGRMSVRGVLA